MSTFNIAVRTSDKRLAGTDASVYIILHGSDGEKSQTMLLDRFFSNDMERGQTDKFEMVTEKKMESLSHIEIWRDDAGIYSEWHLDYVIVENVETTEEIIFPFIRWVKADTHYFIEPYDWSLPQNSMFKEQREAELKRKLELYQYKSAMENLPVQVKELPEDEQFSRAYEDQLSDNKWTRIYEKLWICLTQHDKDASFDSYASMIAIYDDFDTMEKPKNIDNWNTDVFFGQQRLNGCNPELIALCTAIPEKFAVDPEALKPLLEDKTVDEAIAAKKLFIIDLTILEGISTMDDCVLTNPYCLLYLNNDKKLVPVAIQLFKEPSDTNPVFYSSDDPYVWTVAKMWYCLADSSYHQSAAHLGATHLMMEGLATAMNRTLSPSHPIYKLLAPHFLYLLAINNLALARLVAPGGWIDMTMAIGAAGVLEIIAKRFVDYDISKCGNLLNDMKLRGVDSAEVLPNYHYRDDATLLFQIIHKYCTDLVKFTYKTEEDIVNDTEIQAWGKEMITPKPDGLGFVGVPGEGKFSTYEHLATILSYTIFSCSVEHAAVNFSQYDCYAFPLAYPVKMKGAPPKDKKPLTEKEVLATMYHKDHMMNTMVVTSMLSERGTRALGDFEINYIYHPEAVKIVDKFREDLAAASVTIDEREKTRDVKYEILNPKEVPNAISI